MSQDTVDQAKQELDAADALLADVENRIAAAQLEQGRVRRRRAAALTAYSAALAARRDAEQRAATEAARSRREADAAADRERRRALELETYAADRAAREAAEAQRRAARHAQSRERAEAEAAALQAALAARHQALLDELPARAAARWAACRADADLDPNCGKQRFGGFPPAARNFNELEEEILYDPAKTVDAVSTALGVFPYHVQALREKGRPQRKQAKGPGRPPTLSDDAVREIRRSAETAKVLAALHGVSPGYVGAIRRGEVRMDVAP